MTTSQFFGYESYAAYRAAFRGKAFKRRIDPVRGANSFQVVLLNAERSVETHFDRMAAATRANAELPSGWARYGDIAERIERMARRDWWQDELFWRGRCACTVPSAGKMPAYLYRMLSLILPPDVEALFNLRAAINAQEHGTRATRFREVWNDLPPASSKQRRDKIAVL